MKTKIFSWIITFAMVLSLLPAVGVMALAIDEQNVPYIDENGESKICDSAIVVTDSDTSWVGGTSTNPVWYIVNSSITNTNRITVSGYVCLILKDGVEMKANNGITVASGSPINSLTIYGQNDDSGRLIAKVSDGSGNAAIGGLRKSGCGAVTINGGYVVAMGSSKKDSPLYAAAGIGGGSGGSGGLVTVNGGTVLADGGHYIYDGHKWGAGIGAGYGGESAGSLYVHSGSFLVKVGSSIATDEITGYTSSTNLQEDGHLVNKMRVSVLPYVASVKFDSDTIRKYTDIQNAIFDAVDGINEESKARTVTLEKNYALPSSLLIESGKYAILDLNGKKLTVNSYSSGIPAITNNGTLSITDSTEGIQGSIVAENGTGTVLKNSNGITKIVGGCFNGIINKEAGTVSIKSGKFSVDPSNYLAEGYEKKTLGVEDAPYLYEVVASKKKITISDITAFDKVYDGTNYAKIEYSVNGLEDCDLPYKADIISCTSTFSDKNIGNNKPIKINFSISENYKNKYVLESDSFTANQNITKRTIKVKDGISAINRSYDKDNLTVELDTSKANLVYTDPTKGDQDGLVNGDIVTINAIGTMDSPDCGKDKPVCITYNSEFPLTGKDAGNYCIDTSNSQKETSVTITESAECVYTIPLCSGENKTLVFGDNIAPNTYTIIRDSKGNGYKLIKNDGDCTTYISFDKNTVIESEKPFTWKYDGGLYAETYTYQKIGKQFKRPILTKKYLTTLDGKLTTSSKKVFAFIQIKADKHDLTYFHNGDGFHEAYCIKCHYRESPVKHKYDNNTHLCICGKYDPSQYGVKNVIVKEKKTRNNKYQYTISTDAKNVSIKKVEYNLDGNKWRTGTSFTSNRNPIEKYQIRVTDSKGNITYWDCNRTTVKQTDGLM